MSGLSIAICALLLAYLYPWIIESLKVNKNLLTVTILYIAGVVLGTVLLAYLFQEKLTSGEMFLLPIAIGGVIIRVGVYYFRRNRVINSRP